MTDPPPSHAFDFGENWLSYVANSLTPAAIDQATHDFQRLFADISLANATFLDIGFGQGLSLCLAAKLGARTLGCDLNPKCPMALAQTRTHFPKPFTHPPAICVASILDPALPTLLAEKTQLAPPYDIVHSWGVLHHTGAMWQAIENAAALVKPNGHFALAIYQTHWSSPLWSVIKRIYVHAPRPVRSLMIHLFTGVIFLAKWIVTRKNPFLQDRGMEFRHNVVDWVGGWPYEHAAPCEITEFLHQRGFQLLRQFPPAVPTGCGEYLFQFHPGSATD